MSDPAHPPRLTSDQVALVLRRAAELDALLATPAGDDGYDPVAVEEAAREVGLSPAAVRQAVAELRVGALPVPGANRRPARPVRSRMVTQQRLVEVPPPSVHASVDRFMRTQMFELRRRAGDRSLYRPRSDLVASLRRGLDFAGVIRLDGLRTVSVTAVEADEMTLVRVEAELTTSRANAVAGGAAAGTSVALLTGMLGAIVGEVALVVGALPAGAAIGAGSVRVAEARWRKRRDDVAEALGSLLDRL
jgi:hypothetical protein